MIVVAASTVIALIGLILYRLGSPDWKQPGLVAFGVGLLVSLLAFGGLGLHIR